MLAHACVFARAVGSGEVFCEHMQGARESAWEELFGFPTEARNTTRSSDVFYFKISGPNSTRHFQTTVFKLRLDTKSAFMPKTGDINESRSVFMFYAKSRKSVQRDPPKKVSRSKDQKRGSRTRHHDQDLA